MPTLGKHSAIDLRSGQITTADPTPAQQQASDAGEAAEQQAEQAALAASTEATAAQSDLATNYLAAINSLNAIIAGTSALTPAQQATLFATIQKRLLRLVKAELT